MHKNVSALFANVLIFVMFILFSSQHLHATEEYAKQTGQACAACHLDSGGGGELTAAGKAFAESLKSKAANPVRGALIKGFRLVIGYLHFLTAIFWFGTILYVHLVLKPAYAAGGLPRGELRVGIISMVVMGVTGAILTSFRINSVDTLIHSHFGILLIIKVSLYLVMVISAVIVITVIGPRLKAKRKEIVQPVATGNLTPDELAVCDGKEGRPAYFAFEGKVYDATQSKLWKQGVHMGRHNAGVDLTEALELAPHGMDKVSAMREVGLLTAVGLKKKALHERVFYFMAYMNLTIVLVIILILTLWRWG